MIARLLILLLLTRMPLLGESEDDVTSVVSTLATALSENNPPLFLKSLDHDMPNYREIERRITALASDTLINCTIELIGSNGSSTAQQADLDWYMVLRSQQDENLIERRRAKVTVKVEKRGKKWIVTSFSPLSIFAPMAAR
jgi:hypothetical protein